MVTRNWSIPSFKEWSADTGYFYVCIATNTWLRCALATW